MHTSPKFSLRSLLSPPIIAVGVIATLLAAPSAFAKKDLFATDPGAKHTPPAEQLVPASSTAPETFKTNDKAQAEAKPSEAAVNATQNPTAEAKIESSAMQKELVAPKESSTAKEPSANREPSASKEPSANKESSANKEPSAIKDQTTNKNSSSSKDSASAKDEPSALEVQMARLKRNLTKTKNDLFGSKSSSEKKAAPQTTEPQLTDSTSEEEDAKTAVATISTTEAAQRAQTFAEGQVINVRLYQESGQEGDKPRYAVKLLQKNGRMKTINLDAVNGALIEEKPAEETPQ